MADEEKSTTVVTYDVSDAVEKLGVLDKAVAKATDSAEKSFDKLGGASKGIARDLADMLPKSGLVGGAVTFAGAFAAGAAGAIALGKGIGTVTAEVLRLATGWESANDEIEDFIRLSHDIDRNTRGTSGIREAAIEGRTQGEILRLRKEAEPIRGEQIEVRAAERSASARLDVARDFYRELDRMAQESTRKREQLEDGLKSLVSRTNERRLLRSIEGGSSGFQVNKLIEEANKLKDRGDFDDAESLLNRALDRAGGNASAIRVVEEAFDSLIAAQTKGVNQAKAEEAALTARVAGQKAVVDGLTVEVQLLKERNAQLAAAVKINRLEQQRVRNAGAEAVNTEQVTQRNKELEQSLQRVGERIDTNRGAFQTFKDAFSGLATGDLANAVFGAFTGDSFSAQNAKIREGLELAERIQRAIQASPSNAPGQEGNLNQLAEILSEIEGNPNLFDSLIPEKDRLRGVTDELQKQLEIIKELRRTQNVGTALQGESFNPVPRPRVPAPATGQGAAAGTRTTNNQVTVNATVKGGIVDGEVARQLTEIIRREVRRGLTEQANV
jgi:hypothetical protein